MARARFAVVVILAAMLGLAWAGWKLVTTSEPKSRALPERTQALKTEPVPAATTPPAFPRVGLAVRDTALAWCMAVSRDSVAPAIVEGQRVAIVFGTATGPVSLRAHISKQRTAPCHAEFAQPRWFDYDAYDLALDESAPTTDVRDVALAALSDAMWSRGPDGLTRADLDGDGAAEEARRCTADEGEHFTIWSLARDASQVRRAHEYYDWGALTDPTCKPGENGLDP